MLQAIRITDPYLIRQILDEQVRREDGTATKTAARLLTERLAQLEVSRSAEVAIDRARRRRAS